MELPASSCKSIFTEGQKELAAFSVYWVVWALPNMNYLFDQKCERILS